MNSDLKLTYLIYCPNQVCERLEGEKLSEEWIQGNKESARWEEPARKRGKHLLAASFYSRKRQALQSDVLPAVRVYRRASMPCTVAGYVLFWCISISF